jgi:hypothetical protein
MKQPAKFGVLVLIAVLLSNATSITQAQISGEVGRGFPYSSGGSWSDLFYVAIGGIVLFSIIGILMKLWEAFWYVVSRLSKWLR